MLNGIFNHSTFDSNVRLNMAFGSDLTI